MSIQDKAERKTTVSGQAIHFYSDKPLTFSLPQAYVWKQKWEDMWTIGLHTRQVYRRDTPMQKVVHVLDEGLGKTAWVWGLTEPRITADFPHSWWKAVRVLPLTSSGWVDFEREESCDGKSAWNLIQMSESDGEEWLRKGTSRPRDAYTGQNTARNALLDFTWLNLVRLLDPEKEHKREGLVQAVCTMWGKVRDGGSWTEMCIDVETIRDDFLLVGVHEIVMDVWQAGMDVTGLETKRIGQE